MKYTIKKHIKQANKHQKRSAHTNTHKKAKKGGNYKKAHVSKQGGGKTAEDKLRKYRLNVEELHNCFGELDVTQQLHQIENLNQYVGEVNNTTFTPKITVTTERSYNSEFAINVSLKVEYFESNFNNQVAEFKIETDVPMKDQLKDFFIIRHNNNDKLVFHPIHFLFYQGSSDLPDSQSCPSMGIFVNEAYEGIGFARNMIKMALIALQNLTNNSILSDPENNFGGSLESQIVSIDGDGSGGFWEHIGMYEDAKAGYDYVGKQKRRCIGMEKIIPIIKMYNWAFSK